MISDLYKSFIFRAIMLIAVTGLTACATSSSKSNLPATTPEGLVLVEDREVYSAYVDPDADFSVYNKFFINVADVRFKAGWENDMRQRSAISRVRITDADKDRIRRGLSELFTEVFTEELESNGQFEVVDTPGPDVLALNVAIVDLYIQSPDVGNTAFTDTYVRNAGSMVLVGSLIDSTTGDVLAEFSDGRAAREEAFMQLSSGVYNRAEARRMLRRWAVMLRESMEEVHSDALAN